MRRDLGRLSAEPFDLLVVGAGIYGAAIAREAAQRGLTVALVDRGDIGAATSFNNAKTLHGGVRSLQGGRLGELREYVRERRAMLRMAPHLVRPLPFLVPTTKSWTRNQVTFGLYFAAYDLFAHDRNQGLDPALILPGSHLVSRQACLAEHPVVSPDGVTGGVRWYDGQMRHGDRMTLLFATSAAADGAAVATYVAVDGWLTQHARVHGVRATDRLTGTRLEIRARITVNATGPHTPGLLASLFNGSPPPVVPALSLAMNLVTRRAIGETAVGGLARGRLFFLAPWADAMIAGTSHDPFAGSADDLAVTAADVDRLVADLNTAFPRVGLTRPDIRLVHRGLLPAAGVHNGEVRLLKHSVVRDHQPDGWDGVISTVGVRYTTARHTAEQTVDLVGRKLGRALAPSTSATTALAGGDIADLASFLAAAPDPRLAGLYGTHAADVTKLAASAPALAEPLGPDCPTIGAEILYAVREELAVHLGDAILRRTAAGMAGHPGRLVLDRAAAIMAAELGWGAARRREEIADVERTYIVP